MREDGGAPGMASTYVHQEGLSGEGCHCDVCHECARCGRDEEGVVTPFGWTPAVLSLSTSSRKSGSLCHKDGIIVDFVRRVLDFSPGYLKGKALL